MRQDIKVSIILLIGLLGACQMPMQNQEDPSRMLSILTGKGKEPKTAKKDSTPEISKAHVIDVLAGKTEARFWLQHLIRSDDFGSPADFDFLKDLDQQQRQSPDLDKNCNHDVLTYLGCYQSLRVLSLHFEELLVEPSLESHYQKHFPSFKLKGQVPSVLALGDFKLVKVTKSETSKEDHATNLIQGEKIRQEWVDKIRLFSNYHQQKNPNQLALKNSVSGLPWTKLINMYLDRLELQEKDLKRRNEIYMQVMTQYLQAKDSFAKVILQEDQAKALNNADSSLIGLGVEIATRNQMVTVQSVVEGSGADLAGLKAGDQFLAIAGVSVVGASFEEFRKLSLGAENSQVTVKVQRLQGQYDFVVTRKKVVFLNVSQKTFGPAVYVKIRTFMDMSENGQSLSAKFTKLLSEVQKSSKKAIIIDLRGNGGGLLSESLRMLAPLVVNRLQNGVLLFERTIQVAEKVIIKPYPLPPNSVAKFDKQVIVLIDSGSASASEVFAGTIQAAGAGWVVGQRSFGKGSIQALSPGVLPHLLVGQTTGYYYFTNQVSPHVDGVTPDFIVKTENEGLRLKELEPAEDSQNSKPWVNPRSESIQQLQSCATAQSAEFIADEELKFALNLLNCLP